MRVIVTRNRIDISEKYVASVFRVEIYEKKKTETGARFYFKHSTCLFTPEYLRFIISGPTVSFWLSCYTDLMEKLK
jgi:hypothetical protein